MVMWVSAGPGPRHIRSFPISSVGPLYENPEVAFGGIVNLLALIELIYSAADQPERAEIVYQTLKPHLRRALTLHQKFAGLEAASLGLERALDSFGHSVFGLDRAGHVVIHNRSAEAIIRKGECPLPVRWETNRGSRG